MRTFLDLTCSGLDLSRKLGSLPEMVPDEVNKTKEGLTANEAAMPIRRPPFYCSVFHSIRAVIQKLVYCSQINL